MKLVLVSRDCAAARPFRACGRRASRLFLSGHGMTDDSRKTFTVNDRRHFTPEGEVRAADAPEEAPAPSGTTPREDPPPAPGAAAADAGGAGELPDEPLEFPSVPTDLAGLIASLAAQAAYVMAAPVKGDEARAALESAKSVITLLEALKDKTEGRRSRDEEDVLDSVLYELRMAFVARSRAGGA